ncbi:MAG: hypothetical protein ACI4TR_04480 [Bacteroidaceae bacterium]
MKLYNSILFYLCVATLLSIGYKTSNAATPKSIYCVSEDKKKKLSKKDHQQLAAYRDSLNKFKIQSDSIIKTNSELLNTKQKELNRLQNSLTQLTHTERELTQLKSDTVKAILKRWQNVPQKLFSDPSLLQSIETAQKDCEPYLKCDSSIAELYNTLSSIKKGKEYYDKMEQALNSGTDSTTIASLLQEKFRENDFSNEQRKELTEKKELLKTFKESIRELKKFLKDIKDIAIISGTPYTDLKKMMTDPEVTFKFSKDKIEIIPYTNKIYMECLKEYEENKLTEEKLDEKERTLPF